MCFRNHRGFTLTELMIVVAIVGILAAIAIPNYLRYQLRSRRAEGATNVAAIRTSQIAHFGVHDRFVTVASPNPPGHPFTTQRQPWDYNVPGWKELGLEPEGEVYYQYWTEGGTDDEVSTFIVSAIADLDEDGAFSCWAFARPLLDGDGEPNSSLQLPAACGDGTNIDSDGAPQPISPEYNRVYLPSGDSRY